MIGAAWGRVRRSRLASVVLRKLLIAVALLLVVVAAFAAGIRIYAAAPVWQPLLLAWWPGLLPGVVTIVALGAWWLWWRLPKRQVDRLRHPISDPKGRADVEDNFRKTIGQLLGGAAVLIGAGFAYLQFQQQQTSAHDLLISNQVAKGFELLGNKEKDLSQRLGGIYALEGVMNTSEQYHQPVLEALCAFVRKASQEQLLAEQKEALEQSQKKVAQESHAPTQAEGEFPPLANDIQAALTVIGRRKAGPGTVDLSGAHIPGALLFGADLRVATLRDADLRGALLGSADLSGGAYLDNADLRGAFLFGANLSGANLALARLRGAILSSPDLYSIPADLSGTYLFGADLSGAILNGAKNLTQHQLDIACGDENTKLDPPLTIKPCRKQ